MRRLPHAVVVVVIIATVLTIVQIRPSRAATADCSSAYVEGMVPLTDLGTGSYQGAVGGLYPGGSNDVPADHLALGLDQAADVVPRSTTGQPAANGTVGLLSIGVSNTSSEFRTLMMTSDESRAPEVELVNGAQSGEAIAEWLDPNANAWKVVAQRLADAGLSPAQVQVAWIKLPEREPSEQFPIDAETYSKELATVIRNLHDAYPSVKIAYISSRIYAGYGDALNPEPWAYQNGFGVKWTIEAQLNGDPGLNADPGAGTVEAPWLAWGPYMWANGLGPDREVGGVPGRSDGLEWLCEDFRADGIHPSDLGGAKVANLLRDFFHSDPTACGWYLSDPAECGAPSTPPPPGELPPGASLPFSDIGGSIFVDDIIWLADNGITRGCDPAGTMFCPDDPVTRGQMAAFLTRALDLPAGPDVFTDDDSSLFENDINALARAGITRGCDPAGTMFCPDDPVTRGQMAAFLTRALDLPAGPDVFTDDDSSLFENDINALARAGITRGCDPAGTMFCPDDPVTRGQMAAFLHRALDLLPG